jgi:hypothetical protein
MAALKLKQGCPERCWIDVCTDLGGQGSLRHLTPNPFDRETRGRGAQSDNPPVSSLNPVRRNRVGASLYGRRLRGS